MYGIEDKSVNTSQIGNIKGLKTERNESTSALVYLNGRQWNNYRMNSRKQRTTTHPTPRVFMVIGLVSTTYTQNKKKAYPLRV